jgi:hypothetical protein
MAKHIKSLSNEARTAKQVLANSPVSKRVRKNGKPVEPLKGKPARVESTRRKDRDLANVLHKIVTLRDTKKAAGPKVERERKAVHSESLFAGMTPRQVKRLKKRPEAIKTLRKELEAKRADARRAEQNLVDENRAKRARIKARTVAAKLAKLKL